MQERIRSCDNFGVPINLKLGGNSVFQTAGGGLVSIFLKILITIYFCIQVLNVVNFNDS